MEERIIILRRTAFDSYKRFAIIFLTWCQALSIGFDWFLGEGMNIVGEVEGVNERNKETGREFEWSFHRILIEFSAQEQAKRIQAKREKSGNFNSKCQRKVYTVKLYL